MYLKMFMQKYEYTIKKIFTTFDIDRSIKLARIIDIIIMLEVDQNIH